MVHDSVGDQRVSWVYDIEEASQTTEKTATRSFTYRDAVRT